jgi:hypothetical protein
MTTIAATLTETDNNDLARIISRACVAVKDDQRISSPEM